MSIYGEKGAGTVPIISVIIDAEVEDSILEQHREDVVLEGFQEMFAFFGKINKSGHMDYKLYAEGISGKIGFDDAIALLRRVRPDLFDDLLLAVLNNVGENELNEVLDLTGWNSGGFPDVAIVLNESWVYRKLDEKAADELWEELIVALKAYFDKNGYNELSFGVLTYEYEVCDCCAEYCLATMAESDRVDAIYHVEFTDEKLATLESGIENDVLGPILKKYGLDAGGAGDAGDAETDAGAEAGGTEPGAGDDAE